MAEPLSLDVSLGCPYTEALERVVDALAAEGFGVLTRIDVHDAMQEKLGVDFRAYSILGACQPALAHEALLAAPEAGLLLPCNVVVEEREGGGSLVRIANPIEVMRAGGLGSDDRVAAVGRQAYERLERVADALATTQASA